MSSNTITLWYNEDVRDEFGPINAESDMLDNYRDMIDEVYGTVEVAGYTIDTARVLEQVDEIAFRQGFFDYCDNGWSEVEVPLDVYLSDDDDAVRAYIVAGIDGKAVSA